MYYSLKNKNKKLKIGGQGGGGVCDTISYNLGFQVFMLKIPCLFKHNSSINIAFTNVFNKHSNAPFTPLNPLEKKNINNIKNVYYEHLSGRENE